MADENQNKSQYEEKPQVHEEVKERGFFDFLGKKKEEEKPQVHEEKVIVADEDKNKSHTHDHDDSNDTDVEVKERGMFDFLGKKKEQEKPQAQEEVLVTEFDKFKVSDEPEFKQHENENDGEKMHRDSEKLYEGSDVPETKLDEKDVENKEKCLSEMLHNASDEEEKIDEEKKHNTLSELLHNASDEPLPRFKPHQKDEEKHSPHSELLHNASDPSDDKEERSYSKQEDIVIPVEKVQVDPISHPHHHEEADPEKKGFLDKIKDKLSGHHKKTEEEVVVPLPEPEYETSSTTTTTADHEEEAKEKKGFMEKIKEKLPVHHPKESERATN